MGFNNKLNGVIKDSFDYLRPFSFVNVLFYLLLASLWVFIACFLMLALKSEGGNNFSAYIAIIASIIALTTLTYNARRHISEDYTKDAKEYLKRAYEILAPENPGAPPPNTRMAWLTAARNLKIAERLGNQIIMSSHKEIFIEERQFWRIKLGGIIKNFPTEYYAESAKKFIINDPGDREPLSEYSLYVIHKFIEWDDNYKDSLDEDRFSEEDKLRLLRRGFTNLHNLLLAVDRYRLRR
ncbi:hypothetical protein HU826_07700 [Enterobacter cancerogenus]|uniref:hypothetical protein n=1 Tax=Enterobacter cancerogenus TaxID=69218 RepID=UPI001CA3BEB5|nr:hypothetical protein [Enterobacter cancerogenus]QZY38375.1 hypothetical protein HU826_07700 [Enterobacter cancerogenus]